MIHLHIKFSVFSHQSVMIKVNLFGTNIILNTNLKGGKEMRHIPQLGDDLGDPQYANTNFFKRFYIFRERGREGKREGNINVWLPLECPLLGTWPTTQACALTGN